MAHPNSTYLEFGLIYTSSLRVIRPSQGPPDLLRGPELRSGGPRGGKPIPPEVKIGGISLFFIKPFLRSKKPCITLGECMKKGYYTFPKSVALGECMITFFSYLAQE